MTKPIKNLAQGILASPGSGVGGKRMLLLASALLVLGFCRPLIALVRFAADSDLYSHIILVPFVSAYLVWLKLKNPPPRSDSHRKVAVLLWALGLVVLAAYWLVLLSGRKLPREDLLATTTLSFLLLFAGTCCLFLGRATMRVVAFPLGFLVFMIPFPVFIAKIIEAFLLRGSAEAAFGLINLAGTAVFREGLIFQLPGITLEIGPECSGMRSSLVLLISSIVAGHLFLRSWSKRAILAAAVVPLAVVRNGLRVFTIGELCVHVGPEMIDSYIHRHGGPLFFVLALAPFFLLLLFLVRSERINAKDKVRPTEQ